MKKNKRFQEVCTLWLAYKAVGVKESTYAAYERTVKKKIIPRLGNMKCKSLDLANVMKFIHYLEKETTLSDKSVLDIVVVLKGILKYGINLKVIDVPLEMVPLPKAESKAINVIRPEEMQEIIDYISSRKNYRDLGMLISIYAGARLGEVCALKWSNVHLKEGYIEITRTVQRIAVDDHTKLIESSPKTRHSIRKFPIQPALMKILKKEKLEDDNYVTTGSCEFLESRLMQMHLKKTLETLQLPVFNYHLLRHTFASRCIQCEVDVKSLSIMLGHSSVNITLNKYVHSSLDEQKRQLNKLSFL